MNPLNLYQTTDFSNDYIIYKMSKSYTVNGATQPILNDKFAHNLSFAPLIDGVWSFASDFSESRSLIDAHLPYLSGMATIDVVVASDDTYIYIQLYNGEFPYTQRTFYLKLWGYRYPNTTEETLYVTDNSNFNFNTDFNYLKVYKTGVIDVPPSTSSSIEHNLGFAPRVLVWSRYLSGGTPDVYTESFSKFRTEVNENNIFIKPLSVNMRYAYRIYAND